MNERDSSEPSVVADPESLTEALQSQVAFFKNANENLQFEIKTLVNENGQITKQLDDLLKYKYEFENKKSIENIEEKSFDDLKNKLILSEKEKQSFASLWHTAQATIKNLEEELQAYQLHQQSVSYHGNVDSLKKEYSSALHLMDLKLKETLENLELKEKSSTFLEDELTKVKKQLAEKEKAISELLGKQNELQSENEKINQQLTIVKNELNCYKKSSEKLMNDMEDCQNNAEDYLKREAESRMKVAEALKIVDALTLERDTAIDNEKLTAEECKRLNNRVSEVLNESSLRVQREVEIARQTYNDKLNEMLIHIQRLELEMGEKNLFLERALRDCKILEDEIDRRKKGNISNDDNGKMLMLEQKLEATFQQLVISERRNIQIISEKESLQMDLEQIAERSHADRRKKEWEDRLRHGEMKNLRRQMTNAKNDLDNAHKTIRQLQTEIDIKEELNDALQKQRICASKEFERHFETQQKLNRRWKAGIVEMTGGLERRLEELKLENKLLKRKSSKSGSNGSDSGSS